MNSPHNLRGFRSRTLWLIFILLGLVAPAAYVPADTPSLMHIGIVKSVFRDIPDPVVKALMIPFGSLMQQQTGLDGRIDTCDDAFDLSDQLEKGKMDLGVFHGFEFAWVQERFPKLKPLMIAVNQHRYFAVHLVTRDGSTITDFDGLKGKKVSLPNRSREHCHLFVERHCEKVHCTAEKYFAKLVKHCNVEDALDDVVRGEVDAAVVDSLSLDCYGTVKPGCVPLLKTIEKSDLFPAGVVAYREGSLSDETLNAFRTGMLNANKNAKSRGLMSLFKLTAFEDIPDDYQQALATIRKAFPAPSALVIKMAETTKTDSE